MIMLSKWLFLLLSMFAFAKSGDPPDDDDDDPDDDDPGDDDDASDKDKEAEKDAALEAEFAAIKDRKAKFGAMKDQIQRLHRRLAERDKRIQVLEAEVDAAGSGDGDSGDGDKGKDGKGKGGESGDANELRLENAFLRSAMTADEPIQDMELAWNLLNTKGFVDSVKVADDGTVTGMDDALAKVVERYP